MDTYTSIFRGYAHYSVLDKNWCRTLTDESFNRLKFVLFGQTKTPRSHYAGRIIILSCVWKSRYGQSAAQPSLQPRQEMKWVENNQRLKSSIPASEYSQWMLAGHQFFVNTSSRASISPPCCLPLSDPITNHIDKPGCYLIGIQEQWAGWIVTWALIVLGNNSRNHVQPVKWTIKHDD